MANRNGTSPAEAADKSQPVFAALAHATRRRILLAIDRAGGSLSAGDIARRFAHAWPTTTRHLKMLERVGLLKMVKVGRSCIYRIQWARLGPVQGWLNQMGSYRHAQASVSAQPGVPSQRRGGEPALIDPEDLVGAEWAEWYGLTPVQRWTECEKSWLTYLSLGGSLDPEPDTQSPFFDPGASRQRPAHGRAGVRPVRRGRV